MNKVVGFQVLHGFTDISGWGGKEKGVSEVAPKCWWVQVRTVGTANPWCLAPYLQGELQQAVGTENRPSARPQVVY